MFVTISTSDPGQMADGPRVENHATYVIVDRQPYATFAVSAHPVSRAEFAEYLRSVRSRRPISSTRRIVAPSPAEAGL